MDNKNLCGVIFINDERFLSFHCSKCKEIFGTPDQLIKHLSEHYTEIKMQKIDYQLGGEYGDDDECIDEECDAEEYDEEVYAGEEFVDEMCDDEEYADGVCDDDIVYLKNDDENISAADVEDMSDKSPIINDETHTETIKSQVFTVLESATASQTSNPLINEILNSPKKQRVRKIQVKFRSGRPRKVFDQPREHKCELCGAAFKDKYVLQRHVIRHSGQKEHACPKCPKKFYTRMELKLHDRRHTGERSYLCMFCGKSFVTSSEFNGHLQRHENKRTYTCDICNKSFFDGCHLREHKVMHSDERAVQCTRCPATFKTKKRLSAHMKIHLNLREHKCNICGAAFNQSPGLTSHMKTKHKIANKSLIN
uniref:C2H2-type domain-containing protein n=1 Tax=Glossina austeni TaxID=7395 RepID=A0A1A9VYU3_GLOAU